MFAHFIRTLTTAENPMTVMEKAFGEVAKRYQIGMLRSEVFMTLVYSTRKEGDRENILFTSDELVEQESGYTITYHIGGKGVIVFHLHRTIGSPAFSEQEKEELKTYTDVLSVVVEKFYLMDAVQQISHTDHLTGLPNTGGFLTYADRLIEKGNIKKYNAFYFNLARFGLVNKRFGTRETDIIIRRYATKISTFLQEDECLGRLGGDNFVALIKKERTTEFLDLIAQVETYGVLGIQEVPVYIEAVAGIYEIDDTMVHCGNLIETSSMAMNVAKHMTKQPYAYASGEMKRKLDQEKQYISRFDEAIKKKEFKAYYQPKVNTEDYSIVGAEALVRWECDGVLIPPMEFIPLFERNGMICALDLYILEQVCSDIRHWLDMGIEPGRISTNLSRRHLSNPNLAKDIKQILSKYEMESRYVEIELTETMDAEEEEQLVLFMNQMKAYHISLSIDDFGTGHSSLELLRSFPVDVLKIDKIFIETLEKNDRIILSNIIRMATELEMQVVAEGVETMTQLECLKEMNCKIVQGSMFDRPLPREEFEQKMKKKTYDGFAK